MKDKRQKTIDRLDMFSSNGRRFFAHCGNCQYKKSDMSN
jgi:hypothetical protein